MTRSAPSISTTGAAGRLEQAEVGEQVGVARRLRSCSERSWPRTFAKTSMAVGI